VPETGAHAGGKRKSPARANVAAAFVAPGHEPVLTWEPVSGASYYNVRLFRDGVRVLDLWPEAAHVTVPAIWVYGGVHYRLHTGRYRWYVYPGSGDASRLLLGKLRKVGDLVVRRPH